MNGNIYVTSFEALYRLEAVLGIFSEDVIDKIQSVGRNVENQLADIENRCQELEREIDHWECEYEQADEEDDTSYLAYKRQEAEEKLCRARNLQRQTEEASENFARCARRVNAVADERMNEARGFLRMKIKELQDYTSVQLEDSDFGAQGKSATSDLGSKVSDGQNTGNLSLSKNSVEDLMKIPLPEGFKWFRLDEISQKEIEELPNKNQFGKGVSYEDMENGLKKLEKEILIVLKQFPEKANADYFEDLDIKNGNDSINGIKKIFNVFFGRQIPEFIRVERFAGESKYDIANGKHRIKVARDLGWKVVPAEIIEVNWKR